MNLKKQNNKIIKAHNIMGKQDLDIYLFKVNLPINSQLVKHYNKNTTIKIENNNIIEHLNNQEKKYEKLINRQISTYENEQIPTEELEKIELTKKQREECQLKYIE